MSKIIENNNGKYDDFINYIREEERVYLFLGAGFSKQMGFWLWDEFVNEVIEKFENLSFSIKEYLKRMDKKYALDYLESIDEDKFYQIVDNLYNEKEAKINTEIINAMYQILHDDKFKIITTNFDKIFKKKLDIEKVHLNFNPDKKINYLHGRIDDKESLILTQKKYFKNYLERNSPIKIFLTNVFSNYPVIFIGYSLSDYEILQILYDTKKSGRNRYVLLPEYNNNKDYNSILEKIYKENFNLIVLKYDIENKGYDALISYLEQINNLLYPKNTSLNAKEEAENAK